MLTKGLGLIGRKAGMTRVFAATGEATAVTVLEINPNTVVRVKTEDQDGYFSMQLSTGQDEEKYTKRYEKRLTKPLRGHYQKANIPAGRGLWEFCFKTSTRTAPPSAKQNHEDNAQMIKPGLKLTVSLFSKGEKVDICGRSKGKGFQGGIRRWNFSTQDMTHGNSLSHRSNGSIGQCQTPGRVWKGKKMSGHMGDRRVTTIGLEVFAVDESNNLLLIKGAVPGAVGSDVMVRPSIKDTKVGFTDLKGYLASMAASSNDGANDEAAQSIDTKDSKTADTVSK